LWAPRAKEMVITAGRASGIAATASEMDVRSMNNGPSPRRIPIPKIIPHMARTAKASFVPKLVSRF